MASSGATEWRIGSPHPPRAKTFGPPPYSTTLISLTAVINRWANLYAILWAISSGWRIAGVPNSAARSSKSHRSEINSRPFYEHSGATIQKRRVAHHAASDHWYQLSDSRQTAKLNGSCVV